jgi:YgiT-type zinc finger domain-containing protein
MYPYGDCYYCGGEIIEKPDMVDYRISSELYILENIPTGICVQCGEKFFKAEVLKYIEKAVREKNRIVREVRIPILDFAGVFSA